jgi:hypothetical protein
MHRAAVDSEQFSFAPRNVQSFLGTRIVPLIAWLWSRSGQGKTDVRHAPSRRWFGGAAIEVPVKLLALADGVIE